MARPRQLHPENSTLIPSHFSAFSISLCLCVIAPNLLSYLRVLNSARLCVIAPHLLPSHCVLHTSAPSRVRSPQLIPNHCYLITALQAPASACSLALLIPDT